MAVVAAAFCAWAISARSLQARMQQRGPVLPDMTSVADGTYVGEAMFGPVRAKVQVSVAGHAVRDVRILEHVNGLGAPAEGIVQDVVRGQSLDVDAVAGATISSRCILEAIGNALGKGERTN